MQVVRTETGNCNETMFRKSWDVTEFTGQYAQVRLVDNKSANWAHINFDDLKGDIICPHYLNENNWRESKGTKDKRFQVFTDSHLLRVRFNSFWYCVVLY